MGRMKRTERTYKIVEWVYVHTGIGFSLVDRLARRLPPLD